MNTILGLDVGKKWLDVSLYNQETKPLYKRFTNNTIGHKALVAYLDQVSVTLYESSKHIEKFIDLFFCHSLEKIEMIIQIDSF